MKNLFLLISVFCLIGFIGCRTATEFVPSENAKTYPMRGKVLSVDRAKKKISVDHEKIEGYMDAMTMDFPVKDDFVFEELAPGAIINAELVVDNSAEPPYWLQSIAISAAPKAGDSPLPVKEDVAIEGRAMINFTLTDQDGKEFKPAEFKGKSWAMTFIYSECPLADYCIAMSKRFSDTANKVAADPALKDSIRLLSISFDPKRDTPERLRSYGLGYLGKDSPDKNFEVWKLAVGSDEEVRKVADFVGLRYEVDETNKTEFNHSLRTVVVTPEGNISKVFTGNDWSESQLLDALKANLE